MLSVILSLIPIRIEVAISVKPEEGAHKKIDSLLEKAGWLVQDYDGHTISTYHEVELKGKRGIYAASGLSIEGKTKVNNIDALKEIMRARE